jgi:hypothetical protein
VIRPDFTCGLDLALALAVRRFGELWRLIKGVSEKVLFSSSGSWRRMGC